MATDLKFPRRNLGKSEDWGRKVESVLKNQYLNADLLDQTLENLTRRSEAQSRQLIRRIEALRGAASAIRTTNDRLDERLTIGEWTAEVNLNSFSSQETVTAPEWAESAIVLLGLNVLSNPSSGWSARIDGYSETSSIGSGNIDEHRVVLQGGVGQGSTGFVSYSFPGVRFLSESSRTIYLRLYGLQTGGGSTSYTHRFQATYSILWVGPVPVVLGEDN